MSKCGHSLHETTAAYANTQIIGLTLAAVTAEIICDALAPGGTPAPALDMRCLDPIAMEVKPGNNQSYQ